MLNMTSIWEIEVPKTNHPAACPEDHMVAPLLPLLQLSAAALANTVAAAATKRVMMYWWMLLEI
jgi:hypothetical protein